MRETDTSPLSELDIVLNESEIKTFTSEAVWPVIDKLYGKDFVIESLPGENISYEKMMIDRKDDKKVRVSIYVECFTESDEYTDRRICSVRIAIGQERSDLTGQFTKLATDEYEEEIAEYLMDGVSGWHEKSFTFIEGDDEALPVEIDDVMGLIDVDGELLWDNTLEILPLDCGVKTETDDYDLFVELESEAESTMKEKDRLLILAGFIMAGLMDRV